LAFLSASNHRDLPNLFSDSTVLKLLFTYLS
jgi:hypothetical protein